MQFSLGFLEGVLISRLNWPNERTNELLVITLFLVNILGNFSCLLVHMAEAYHQYHNFHNTI
jgi:hypothetical protein